MNVDSTYNLGSEGIHSPEEPDGSHIIPHGVKLVGGQVEPLCSRPIGLRNGAVHVRALSGPSLASGFFFG